MDKVTVAAEEALPVNPGAQAAKVVAILAAHGQALPVEDLSARSALAVDVAVAEQPGPGALNAHVRAFFGTQPPKAHQSARSIHRVM